MKKRYIVAAEPTVACYYDGNEGTEDLVGIGDPDFDRQRFENNYHRSIIDGSGEALRRLYHYIAEACHPDPEQALASEAETVSAILNAVHAGCESSTGYTPANTDILALYNLFKDETDDTVRSHSEELEGRRAVLTAATGNNFVIKQMNTWGTLPMTYLGPSCFNQDKLNTIELLLRGLAERCLVSDATEEDQVKLSSLRSMINIRNIMPITTVPFTEDCADIFIQRDQPGKYLPTAVLVEKVARQLGGTVDDYVLVGCLSSGWRFYYGK